jgi:ATP-dependent 26S proteasome regulatory subunit
MAFGRKIAPSESLSRIGNGQPHSANHHQESPNRPDEAPKALQTRERFELREARYRMEDLILPADVLREIGILKSRIENHKLIYHDWEFQKIDPVGAGSTVNFYGPPGTGKTMCAEALASHLDKKILELNYAEIESKYVGETPKNITAAFAQAKQSGALLFFDETDSILGRRLTNVTQSADHGVNVSRAVMLKQLDDFGGVVVFATNLARNFDGAFVRRILQHVCVPLPDETCRVRLWERMIMPKIPGRQAIDFAALARSSDGFSGGEIKNAVLLALSEVAARAKDHQHLSQDDLLRAVESVRRAGREIGNNQAFAVLPAANDSQSPASG